MPGGSLSKDGDPQGFAAVAPILKQFRGVNMLCDISNGTMNVMYINDRRTVMDKRMLVRDPHQSRIVWCAMTEK